MSFLRDPVVLLPPQPLEPPVFLGETKYDTVLLNRKTTSLTQEGPASWLRSNGPTEKLRGPVIQLPAIRSVVPLSPYHEYGISKMGRHVLHKSNTSSASYTGPGQEYLSILRGPEDSPRVVATKTTEPMFATLLTTGSDMKTVLDAMDREMSPRDVLNFCRVDLARPPMPEEPVPDPDYRPRPSTLTGKAPVDAQHSKKETERRAQHKYYLDLSELKIPDYFLKLCGWDEPRELGDKKTPRTKSSILQAGCLYIWFLSGPVLRCFKSLLHNNQRLEEKVQHLENENHHLLLRCQSLQSEVRTQAEQLPAAGWESTLQSPCLTATGSRCSPYSSALDLKRFTVSEKTGSSRKHDTLLSLLSECSARAPLRSGKRRSPSTFSYAQRTPTSPPKRRKTHKELAETQDATVRSTFDDIENLLLDIAIANDHNMEDVKPTRMYGQRSSSAPSQQSATPSCWDSASVTSTSSSWDQPSPHSIADS